MAIAAGCYDKRDVQRLHPQVVVRFDRELFDQIRAFAARDGISFNAAVRLLTEWGLETDCPVRS